VTSNTGHQNTGAGACELFHPRRHHAGPGRPVRFRKIHYHRLLQGINRDYTGAIKIDGTDMREINLRHLRKNFGMVLQDNFLFRGSVRDNILAGRPGLSFEDAVQAARLAGAEEFIERLPNGYDTYIQENSPNLSGGQKQRPGDCKGRGLRPARADPG